MSWYQIFHDGPEYEVRKKKGKFTPPNFTIKDLYDAVPRQLFEKSTSRSLYYIFRHLGITYMLYYLAARIDIFADLIAGGDGLKAFWARKAIHVVLWILYWGWQGAAFAGIWCLGHEAGHDSLSPYPLVNAIIGMLLHTFVLTPYYAWRTTHRSHHKATNSLERDETYMPLTRKDFKLPDAKVAVRMDYAEVLEETPAFTLFKLFIRQFLGFQLYILHNRKGNPKYPPGTSHYNPSSLLFKPEQRRSIIASNVAILSMLVILGIYIYEESWSSAWNYYFLPWLVAHNWIVTFTYLQHSDPTIPYYRKDQWTFARGALATVDRPVFGWVGRFFFHNISSDHLAHHFFSGVPFYNLPQVTKAIIPVLGEYYNYDSTPVLYALWRSFTQCIFIEDEGNVVFFKNQYGEATVEPQTEEL